jgi:hypothetical protein
MAKMRAQQRGLFCATGSAAATGICRAVNNLRFAFWLAFVSNPQLDVSSQMGNSPGDKKQIPLCGFQQISEDRRFCGRNWFHNPFYRASTSPQPFPSGERRFIPKIGTMTA